MIYGGTFDPPHNGHLYTAQSVATHINFNRLIFLPCKIPLLKAAPTTTSIQRLEMLKLALSAYPSFEIDKREVMRSSPSFMLETLASFRQELGFNTAISLCMGIDTFARLPEWGDWQQLLNFSHLVVLRRASHGESACWQQIDDKILQTWSLAHETCNKLELINSAYGKIYYLDAGNYPISSTWLRQQLRAQSSNIQAYIPANVYAYIKEQSLYL